VKSIVLFVTESWWPATSSVQLGKAYLEAMKKYPDDLSLGKPIVRSAIWTDKDAMRSIAISSIIPGKAKENMDLAYKRLLMISSMVEDFKYDIHIAFDLAEGMPLVGLTAPEE
jgi:hypothetical protein